MFNTIAPLTLKCRHSIGPLRANGRPTGLWSTDRPAAPARPASLSDLIKAVFSQAFGIGIEGGERGGLEGEVKRPRSFSYATRPYAKYCRWIMDKPHDFARGRKCHNRSRSYPGEIAVKYAFKMASRYPCHRQRALWSRLVSYQVNIDGGGGGLGFLAAAFSISAFKERIFPHNDGGNNNAAAAAEQTSHRIEPHPPPLCH